MTPAGRNDPCPCGSGRKYKKCCLQKDVAAQGGKILDFTYESLLALRRAATEKLERVIAENAAKKDVEAYRDEYWDTPFLDDEELDHLTADKEAETALSRQMIASLASAFTLEGLTPARFALTHQPDRFTIGEREFLAASDQARLTYLQPREFFPETGSFLAEDIFDGRRYTVFDKQTSLTAKPHDILSGRLVPFPGRDGVVLEPLAGSIIPPDRKEGLLEALAALRDDPELNPPEGEGMHAFLKANPIVFYWIDIWMWHELMFPPLPRLATTDGEEWVSIKARFSARDPEALVAALLRQRNFVHEKEKGAEVFTWMNQGKHALGSLRIKKGKGGLALETNSRERFRKWERKLKGLGEIELLEKREETQQAWMERESGKQGAERTKPGARGPGPGRPAAQPGFSQEDLLEIAPQVQEQMLDRWLREKVPALGNVTPVQAARTAEGRKKLKALLETFENRNAHIPAGSGMWTMDVDKLRKRLGLEE